MSYDLNVKQTNLCDDGTVLLSPTALEEFQIAEGQIVEIQGMDKLPAKAKSSSSVPRGELWAAKETLRSLGVLEDDIVSVVIPEWVVDAEEINVEILTKIERSIADSIISHLKQLLNDRCLYIGQMISLPDQVKLVVRKAEPGRSSTAVYHVQDSTRIGLNIPSSRAKTDTVLAIDCSGSMSRRDYHPSRMEAARFAAESFVKEKSAASGGLIHTVGLVSFSEQATTLLKPTVVDTPAAVGKILRLIGSMEPSGGTAIGEAIFSSIELLEMAGSPSNLKTILLLTDGMSNEGRDPRMVARVAAEKDIRVFCIAIGKKKSLLGREIPRLSHYDPQVLSDICETTSGSFCEAPDRESLVRFFTEMGKGITQWIG